MQKLFPLECESVLQASKRMDGLLIQVMRSFVARGNPDGARAFLRRVGGSSSHFSTLDNLVTKRPILYEQSHAFGVIGSSA